MSTTHDIIHERISAQHFDLTRRLSNDEIAALVVEATQAPSSFNIQHWRFIAVTDASKKEALAAAAYGQTKVRDAPVTFIVLGDLRGHEKLAAILDRSVKASILPADVAELWVNMAHGMYDTNPAFARDEAIRSGSLAAMTLMIAAKAKGLVSGPMIGFDPAEVARIFAIDARYVPVMLLPVGYPAEGNTTRKPRLAVDEILAFNESRIF